MSIAAERNPGLSPMVERPYFTAAIGVILTVGALWGVIILLRIALNGSFTSVGLHEVNAHGHAQIFGWVGLFVMGFAYRMFPLLAGRELPWKRAARVGWLVMLAGVALRSFLQPFVVEHPWLLLPAQAGSLLEVGAIAVFAVQMLWLLRGGGGGISAGSAWLIRGGLFFFFIQAVAAALYFQATATAPDRETLLWYVSNFQPPLRDLQIHGFALLMVLGVGMTMLPKWFGARTLPPRGAMIAAAVLTLAVLGEMGGFLLMRMVGARWAGVWGLSALALLVAAGWVVLRAGLLGPMPAASRATKFIRAAHGWLLLSLAMLVLLPAWQFGVLPALAPDSGAVEMGFSHAYYGSIRHAITVGFVSLMILGMSTRFLERLRAGGQLPRATLIAPFVLVNLGCAMRVFFQAATDIHEGAFLLAGVSGLFELGGIALWSLWLLRAMFAGGENPPAGARSLLTPEGG